MVRPIAPAPASEEDEFTPLEDILRPVSATMVEPLDLPDDRFVPLEDILYAAGSAFARPTGAMDEYFATARKREAEAHTKAIPDAVTDLSEPKTLAGTPQLDLVKPDYPVDTQETQNPQTGEWTRPTSERGKRFATPEEAAYALLREAQTITLNDKGVRNRYGKLEQRETGGFVQVGLDERTGNYFYYYDGVTQGGIKDTNLIVPPNAIGLVHTHPETPGNRTATADNERLTQADADIVNITLDNNRPVLNGKVYDGPVFGGLATPSGKIRFFYASDAPNKAGGPKSGPLNQNSHGIAVPAPTFDFKR